MSARRARIRELIRARAVGTQEELRQLLAREGFEVTQATLSRDLARLGARRAALPDGGTTYELDQLEAGPSGLTKAMELVIQLLVTDSLVVVHTVAGAASAVALAVDRARLPEVAGTIAGDDTIFIAPTRSVAPARLSRRLKSLWMKGGLQ